MMKKFLAILLACLTVFTFASCESLQYTSDGKNHSGGFDQSAGEDDSSSGITGGDDSTEADLQTYTVRLTFGDAPYDDTDGMQAQWSNGYDYHVADFVDGVATMQLMGDDYSITLKGLSDKYSYNPGELINKATRYNPEVSVPVYRIIKASSGTGKTGVDEYHCMNCRDREGVYRTKLTSHGQQVFYEFEPSQNGVYTIESWVSCEGLVNPKLYIYNGSNAYKIYAYTLDEGGPSKGFTRNFKYSFNWDESNVGGVVTFAIGADHKEGVQHDYDLDPVNVDFAIMRDGGFAREDYQAPWILPETIYAEFADTIRYLQTLTEAEFDREGTSVGFFADAMGSEYKAVKEITEADLKDAQSLHDVLNTKVRYADTYLDSSGTEVVDEDCKTYDYLTIKLREKWNAYAGSGAIVGPETNYQPAGSANSVLAFRGENYQVSPVTGIYHCYDPEKYADDPYGFGAGFGPMLFGQIAVATRFVPAAFIAIENLGNNALTVSNGTENYKLFIEGFAQMKASAGSDIGGGQLQGFPGDFDPDKYFEFKGYNDFANADGLVPVTPELKEFFQKYSVNQRLFNDGNGFAEVDANPQVDALEEDQWLFACCYYSNP